MRRLMIPVLLFLCHNLMMLDCAPYKMKAIRAQRDERYELSVRFALKHLNEHPNDRAVIELLDQAARGYFDDLTLKLQHFEKINDWTEVVRLAEQGYSNLSQVARVVGSKFPTRNELDYLQSKREQSELNRANALYSKALQLYQDEAFLDALNTFKQVQSLVRNFKDTNELMAQLNQKLATQNYQHGKSLLNQGKLESALESFEQTAKFIPDFLDVQSQISQVKGLLADSYYDQGQNYVKAGDYKNAYRMLEQALGYKVDHKMAINLMEDVKNKLTVRIAIFPFSVSKLDQNFSGMMPQKILAFALPQKTEFMMFLERENLQKIFEEQALSQTGAIDEKTAIEVGKISGVNTIVVGSISLISDERTGPTQRMLTGHYEKKYRDVKGIERTKQEPFNYTEYEIGRAVTLNLSYRLISVETGEILFNESISERTSDSSQWLTCPTEFIKFLSQPEKNKLKASKEPKSKEQLISQAIEALSKRAASRIVSKEW